MTAGTMAMDALASGLDLRAPCRLPDGAMRAAALARQQVLTKPPGSLGALEDAAVTLAALQGRARPAIDRAWIAVFAGDHGVAGEGVSAFPQAVTGEMVRNFATGGAAISVLARSLGATLEVVQLGTVNDPGPLPGVVRDWIAPQTGNICVAAAMDAAQLSRALQAGGDSVARAAAAGAEAFVAGEMGIGNTTAATALACALLGEPAAALVGAGTGVGAEALQRKRQAVERALARHSDARDPIDVLGCLGGFEIAAIAGAAIAAAQRGLPFVVDGFIATAAVLAAVRIQPGVRPWLLFSHRSHERGHRRLLDALEARPLLDLGLRLGEGSGAAAAIPLLRLACELHAGMATFDQAGVSNA